jgi:catechol 2,3-dioxygenase-like lactoylglutathione lyase family enzyme
MFDHLGLGVSDYAASKAFFLKALAPLRLAFTADSREQVAAFHRAALEAGGQDNGGPGLRPHDHPNYYGAFVIGPDGHNVEAVCHRPAGWDGVVSRLAARRHPVRAFVPAIAV